MINKELFKENQKLKQSIKNINTELLIAIKDIERYKIESHFNKFFQIFNHYQKLIRTFNNKYPTAFNIFLFMCENCDKRNEITVSQIELSKIFNFSERHIRDSIKALSAHKLIKKIKTGRSLSYVINSKIMWKSSLDSKNKFSKFHENPVYLNLKETEKPYRKNILTAVETK